ncbi:MAG: thiolase family protein [Deltaproteobacteria bacterium]|nr:thiolase family protein [Deltaproteobacteria bacterium]MBW1923846.1 thiolase family protein [Deltaproteobacteria bacterium]MBW1949700.1 thiolase family protein [Deltaproteobacteria bacterium]MBW2009156.1 thiolase family protein [Deltaproteobacteria bacterium]MBW2103080.1 thiolase family protein [Deltaproteobacteria bacterium]
MGDRVAIMGVGQTDHRYMRPDVNHEEMIHEAVRLALEDAGLTIRDIDTVIFDNMDLFEGHYLADAMTVDGAGMYLKPGLKMNTGGTSGGTAVATGWQHVASGLFETALVVGWQKQDASPSIGSLVTAREPLYDRELAAGAVGIFATMGLQYMQETGCREEHAALARVIMADNARKNPHAHLKLEITVEDVLASRVLVWPVRLLHMSPTSCGACALVLGSEARARKGPKTPVWIRDLETAHREVSVFRGGCVEPRPQVSAIEVAAGRLYRRNGITDPAGQIDVWELYTPSSWALFHWMELFGICEKGQAWRLVEKEAIRLDGPIPIEPSGGVVSTNPIGASGVIRVAEAALQIRKEAGERQVAKDVKTAVATAWGAGSWIVMFYLTREA